MRAGPSAGAVGIAAVALLACAWMVVGPAVAFAEATTAWASESGQSMQQRTIRTHGGRTAGAPDLEHCLRDYRCKSVVIGVCVAKPGGQPIVRRKPFVACAVFRSNIYLSVVYNGSRVLIPPGGRTCTYLASAARVQVTCHVEKAPTGGLASLAVVAYYHLTYLSSRARSCSTHGLAFYVDVYADAFGHIRVTTLRL